MANGRTPSSLAALLFLLKTKHSGRLCQRVFESAPYLPCKMHILKLPKSVPFTKAENVTTIQRINWMLGNLDTIDIAVCTALLMTSSPCFTPYAIRDAKLVDKAGKKYLEFGDNGLMYRINKQRAKSMKYATLDTLSEDICNTIIDMTKVARAYLKEKKSPAANLLFIKHENGNFSASNALTPCLSGLEGHRTLYDYFPNFGNEFPRHSITLRKIRTTEGVLEWFRTGSLKAVSKKLGNSYKVVLTHYLPAELVAAWNTRLIRRFQNLWLAVAAADESFLLEVTDFHNLSDLHAFLLDMLQSHPKDSSPLAAELHKRYFGLPETSNKPANKEGALHVSISEKALTLLYLYRDCLMDCEIPPHIFSHQDPVTGLSAKYFFDLAEMVQHALVQDSRCNLHVSAESIQASTRAMNNAALLKDKVRWGDLVAERTVR